MQRISLIRLGASAGGSAAQYPLILVLAAVGAVAAAILVKDQESAWLLKLLLSVQLGIPLLLAATAATEGTGGSATRVWLTRGASGLLLFLYYLALPTPLVEASFIRHLQLTVAAHLAVAIAPFVRRGDYNAFWQYNLGLALRLLASLFFSHVLFAGLSVALFALDKLLGVNVGDNVYPQLWVVILFVFNTWYFLAGIPLRPRELETVTTFPTIVKVFAQFILAPLVVVYLAILTAYLVKVITTAEWPSGQIGYLVSSVAVAGIFSLLLLYPLAVRPDVRWVRIYARLYHLLLVPAVVMLLMAIGQRIGQYGVTEARYLLTVMALWLAGIVVVGVFRSRPFLKVIPASLAIVALVTALGPLSAAQMSRRSQLGRLDSLLGGHERLVAGRIVASTATVARQDSQEIGSILNYLFKSHGPSVLGDRVGEDVQEAIREEMDGASANHVPAVDLANLVAAHANLPRVEPGDDGARAHHQVQKDRSLRAVSLGNYDYLIEVEFPRDQEREVSFDGRRCRLTLGAASTEMAVVHDDSVRLELGLAAHLPILADRAEMFDRHSVAPDSLMQLSAADEELGVRLLIESVNWREEEGGAATISDLSGILLVKARR